MLNQSCSQANGKETTTQLVVSLSRPKQWLNLGFDLPNTAFNVLPGPQTGLLISERKGTSLLPSASGGFLGLLTEQPNGEVCNPSCSLSWLFTGQSASHPIYWDWTCFLMIKRLLLSLWELWTNIPTSTITEKIKVVRFLTWLVPCSTPWRK